MHSASQHSGDNASEPPVRTSVGREPAFQPTSRPISVMMVEDNLKFCKSLAELLEQAGDIQCIGCFHSVLEALREIPKHPPDVVLMDIKLPGIDGIECVRQLRTLCPVVDIVMLTAYEQTELIFNALAAGAVGYLLKQASSVEIIAAIREVKRGGSPMTGQIARRVIHAFRRPVSSSAADVKLAPREEQVLDLLAKGLYNKEIADALSIGIGTVHTYIRRIYKKLHVRSRTEAVAKRLGRQADYDQQV